MGKGDWKVGIARTMWKASNPIMGTSIANIAAPTEGVAKHKKTVEGFNPNDQYDSMAGNYKYQSRQSIASKSERREDPTSDTIANFIWAGGMTAAAIMNPSFLESASSMWGSALGSIGATEEQTDTERMMMGITNMAGSLGSLFDSGSKAVDQGTTTGNTLLETATNTLDKKDEGKVGFDWAQILGQVVSGSVPEILGTVSESKEQKKSEAQEGIQQSSQKSGAEESNVFHGLDPKSQKKDKQYFDMAEMFKDYNLI